MIKAGESTIGVILFAQSRENIPLFSIVQFFFCTKIFFWFESQIYSFQANCAALQNPNFFSDSLLKNRESKINFVNNQAENSENYCKLRNEMRTVLREIIKNACDRAPLALICPRLQPETFSQNCNSLFSWQKEIFCVLICRQS
jgi:hypothetical protein